MEDDKQHCANHPLSFIAKAQRYRFNLQRGQGGIYPTTRHALGILLSRGGTVNYKVEEQWRLWRQDSSLGVLQIQAEIEVDNMRYDTEIHTLQGR